MKKNFKTSLALILSLTMIVALAAVTMFSSSAMSKDVTFDFTAIEGFSSWSSSYISHVVDYDEATVTFKSADRQSGTITNMPVTKGQSVTCVVNGSKTITAVELVCKQWGSKAQTITLHTSTDGVNFTKTDITSSSFTLSADDLGEGVVAVQFTFSSSSNQVGIQSLTLTYAEDDSTGSCTHEWDEGETTIVATCDENGEIIYTCSKCGDTKTVTVKALGHTWDDGVVTTEPTCTENGETTFTCTACGETKTSSIASTGHSYVDGVCENCGEEQPEVEGTYASGEYYVVFTHNDVKYYLVKATNQPTLTTDKEVATLLTVTLVAPETYEITDADGNYLYATNTNNGVRFGTTSSSWVYTEVDGVKYFQYNTTSFTRYLTPYVNNKVPQDMRSYQIGTAKTCPVVTLESAQAEGDHTHEWDDGVVTVAPTCTESGKLARTCACGETKVEIIEALGHDFVDGKCTRCDEVVYDKAIVTAYAPEEGKAFVLAVYQNKLGKVLYLNGKMNGYYFATTEKPTEAVKVYVETVDGGYLLYFMNGETKTYLDAVVSGTYKNTVFTTEAPSAVWIYDETLGTWKTELTVNGTASYYFLGTYNTFNTLSLSAESYLTAESIHVSQFPAVLGVAHRCVLTDSTPADCDDPEYLEYTCLDCGESFIEEGEAATGHNYVDGACTVCGAKDPEYVTPNLGEFVTEDGKLYYIVDGEKYVGWFDHDGITYYASSITNVVISGRDAIIGMKQYFWNDETGLVLANGFYENAGTNKYASLDTSNGKATIVTVSANGTICFENGYLVYGWRHADGSSVSVVDGVYEQYSTNPQNLYYFLSSTYTMVTSDSYVLGGWTREFNADHTVKPLDGLQNRYGEVYYYVAGTMQDGWQTIDGNTYYFYKGTGKAATKWMIIGEKVYYFYAGSSATPYVLKTSGAIGGINYTYAEDGSITTTGFFNTAYANAANNNSAAYIQYKDGTTMYYENGTMTEGWAQIGGNWYYFYKGTGLMCTESRTIGGVWYEFTSEGVCTNK